MTTKDFSSCVDEIMIIKQYITKLFIFLITSNKKDSIKSRTDLLTQRGRYDGECHPRARHMEVKPAIWSFTLFFV